MPPRITRVRWSASNVPFGVSFNEATGTFSGTPEDTGEYTVPVRVETNYGTDTKDVVMTVDPPSGLVYAVGSSSEIWSGNAEADANGLRKLNMPNVSRLFELSSMMSVPGIYGFGGKTASGMYVCGVSYADFGLDESFGTATTPKKFPVDNVAEMYTLLYWYSSAAQYGNVYRTSGKKLRGVFSIGTGSYSSYIKITDDDDDIQVATLPKTAGYCHFIAGLSPNNKKEIIAVGVVTKRTIEQERELKAVFGVSSSNVINPLSSREYACYLTIDGELYIQECVSGSTPMRVGADLGQIKDVWSLGYGYPPDNMYVVTGNNKLYVGNSRTVTTEEIAEVGDFTEVGNFNVKRLSGYRDLLGDLIFMLTEDGKLYHKGIAVSGVSVSHDSFTQIFHNYSILDMVYIPRRNTLVMVLEE